MQPVPKMLGHVKQYWNPNTLLVSFKLETDINILGTKAMGAISNYGVDMVVANILATRRSQVIIFHKNQDKVDLQIDPLQSTQVDAISELIVNHIISLNTTLPPSTIDLLKFDDHQDEGHYGQKELFVNMQNSEVTPEQIEELFSQHGKVTRVKMTSQTGKAFV